MASLSRTIRHLVPCAVMLCTLLLDAARFLRCCLRSPAALAAENLFLRKQLALYQTCHVKPRRATDAIRVALVWLSQWFDWQPALAVVHPETFKRWRRQGYHLFWHWTPCPGRPPIPIALQGLIRQMARDNLTWGQRRIANELRLKLGLRVSPRNVRKYLPTHLHPGPGQRAPSQRWRTFLRQHAWDLIVRGVAANLTRGMQALWVWIIQIVQGWWSRSVASGLQGHSMSDAVALVLPSDTIPMCPAWSPDPEEILSADERSPPDMGLLHHHDRCIAARATPVDMFDVCPVVAARCGWNRASPHSRGIQPLSTRGTQAIRWGRAA
jgi:hypothetical protein